MKILIVSDTHGRHGNLEWVLEQEAPIDMFLHLGDVEEDEYYINAALQCRTHLVAGNNDFYSDLPREKEIMIGKYRVYMTHGHMQYVSMNTRRLKEEGRRRQAHIVMYGHTHRPDIDLSEDVIAINPGSLSYPRQSGRVPSYVIMEIDNNGEAHFVLKYVQ
jgi:putative phosphoesterase